MADPATHLYDVVNSKGKSDLLGVVLTNVRITAEGYQNYGYEVKDTISRKSISGSSFQFHQDGQSLDLTVFIPSTTVDSFPEDIVFAQEILKRAADSVSLETGLIWFTIGHVTLYWGCLVDRGELFEYDVSN